MSVLIFIAMMGLCVAVVSVAMWYLRRTMRKVIVELCHSDAGAEFWLRTADILAYSGALILVLFFGANHGYQPDALVETMRLTLILTLSGIFVTVLFVARNVWRTVNQRGMQ